MLTMLTGALLNLVLPSIGTVVGGYAVALLNRALKRAGMKLSAEQDEAIRKRVREAIAFIEEKKRSTSGSAPVPPQRALDSAIGRLAPHLPSLSLQEIEDLIHEELPAVRASLNKTAVSINSGLPGGGRR